MSDGVYVVPSFGLSTFAGEQRKMPLMRIDRGWVVAAMLAILAATVNAPTTTADDKLLFGGGAGIVVDASYCTLTTIGHDKTGELVGFTAAHCGGPGAQVIAEGSEDRVPVGTVVAVNGDLDYAVIKFDPATVTPIPNFAGFVINGIGPDPSPGQPICTQGGATGFNCGYVKFGGRPDIIAANMPSWQLGDNGAPITVDAQLVGMTRKGFTGLIGPPPHLSTHISFELFSAILDDVNANGGLGAGFTPIGS